MNNKVLTIIVIAIVVVAAAAVAIVSLNNGGDSKKKVTIDASNYVYGNANNDAYIDDKDVSVIQDIIDGKATWNSSTNPLADANNDGSIDSKDIAQVKMIINNESGKVWYQSALGYAVQCTYPLVNKNIFVGYWQQAEAAAILGIWDDVKVANAYVTQIKKDQYDLSHVVEVETVSTNKWVANTFTTFAEENINLIMVSPTASNYSAVKAGYMDTHSDCDILLLSHVGTYAIPSILTMGILFNKESRAEAYAEYAYGCIDEVQEKLQGHALKNVIVTMMYPLKDQGATTTVCCGCDLEGSANILSQVANVYSASDVDAWGHATRQNTWFADSEQNKYDVIFMDYSSIDWFTCGSQDTFNQYFDKVSANFVSTYAYQHNGIAAMPYVCGGYAGFAMLYYVAWMLYPELFTLEDAQSHLQTWFDDFCSDKNNKLASGELNAKNAFIYYTGSNYTTLVQKAGKI